MPTEFDAIAIREFPNTRKSLAAELRELGLGASERPLLVHASLSRLGWTCGGSVAVCQALFDVVGAAGDIVMPTQTTEFSDPAKWTSPPVPEKWWPIIRAEMPVFDPLLVPTRTMGQIADTFRSWPETLRSSHPSLSFLRARAAGSRDFESACVDSRIWRGLAASAPLRDGR